MTEAAPKGIRARVRAELTQQIKSAARAQLVDSGADSLSLRAVARDLDMASSAIYRYFPSRDDLLTALIIDAYDALGTAVEAADRAVDPEDHLGRWRAIGTSIRTWAVANPHEYALIYGSPVPGYVAPADTVGPATRIAAVMIALLGDICAARPELAAAADDDLGLDEATIAELAAIGSVVDADLPPAVVIDGLRAWGEVFGLVSLELFGHFANVVTDLDTFFDRTLERSGRAIGAR